MNTKVKIDVLVFLINMENSMENLLVDKSVKRVNFLLSKCNFSFLIFILFLYCIDNLESKCEDAEFSLDYE